MSIVLSSEGEIRSNQRTQDFQIWVVFKVRNIHHITLVLIRISVKKNLNIDIIRFPGTSRIELQPGYDTRR